MNFYFLIASCGTLLLSLFLIVVWKRKKVIVNPTLPTNNLGDSVADAESGRLQAQAEAQRLADASFSIDSQSEDEPNNDGFETQDLRCINDEEMNSNGQ